MVAGAGDVVFASWVRLNIVASAAKQSSLSGGTTGLLRCARNDEEGAIRNRKANLSGTFCLTALR
jgi:hypothetical protein